MPAPRLTVVLVVYRDQAYVEEAVSSVLEQSFGPIEMLAIDNASPDHGPEILDGLAKADGRLDVVRLDRTVGLGKARNIALDSAGPRRGRDTRRPLRPFEARSQQQVDPRRRGERNLHAR